MEDRRNESAASGDEHEKSWTSVEERGCCCCCCCCFVVVFFFVFVFVFSNVFFFDFERRLLSLASDGTVMLLAVDRFRFASLWDKGSGNAGESGESKSDDIVFEFKRCLMLKIVRRTRDQSKMEK